MEKYKTNGAESLVKTLIDSDVDICFTNPGTSEMHFVAALDNNPKMRSVLCLFEGGATGAADGYYRMKNKPASTLLHLGPGLANGLANLHNAKKANSGIVNIVGEHAIDHIKLNAPLTSDIEGIAKPVSHWVKTCKSSLEVGKNAAEAVKESSNPPGKIATLILPGDTAWNEGISSAPLKNYSRNEVDKEKINITAQELKNAKNPMILVGGQALEENNLMLAAKIAAKYNCPIMTDFFNAKLERGAGRVKPTRIPYNVDRAISLLKDFDTIILIGAREPVAFFAYPNKPSILTNTNTKFIYFANIDDNITEGLENLCDYVSAVENPNENIAINSLPSIQKGELNPNSIGSILGNVMPEEAIIVDESISTGREFFPFTEGSKPHTWLSNCGGSIGFALPAATGASLACPDRKVIALEGDGSGMYTLQSLWTMARENLDITVLIFANQSYKILHAELNNVGVLNPGPSAINMLNLNNPSLNWVSISKGMGIDSKRVFNTDELYNVFLDALNTKGPFLIEVMI